MKQSHTLIQTDQTDAQLDATAVAAAGRRNSGRTISLYLAAPAFFLLLLMGQLLLDIYGYEFGHSISSKLAAGWHNSISVEGETFYTDPSYLAWLNGYLKAHGATMQQYLNDQLPDSFDVSAFLHASFQQPGIFWGFAGALLFQAMLALGLFAYSRTPWYRKSAGEAGTLFLSSYVIVALSDVGMRLFNVFTDRHGDDLWLLRVAVFGDNWLLLTLIALCGAGLGALAIYIGYSQFAESISLLTRASTHAARQAALTFTIGVLLVNFGIRFGPIGALLPGMSYALFFLLLFVATGVYAGVSIIRASQLDPPEHEAVRIPAHLIVSFVTLVGVEVFLITQQIGFVTGADPSTIISTAYPVGR